MRIRVRNKFLMFLCGWGLFPSYVEAKHTLWFSWWKREWGCGSATCVCNGSCHHKEGNG